MSETDDRAVELLAFLAERGVEPGAAGKAEAEAFASQLIADGRNTPEVFEELGIWAFRAGHRRLSIALLELVDCHYALGRLAEVVEADHGPAARTSVFAEPEPPVGSPESVRCGHALRVADNLAETIGREAAGRAWFQVQHGITDDEWRGSDEKDRALFESSGSIDEYLDRKRAARDEFLTRLNAEDRPWYTTAITDEVLAFILADPEMETPRRDGDTVYVTKVPYRASDYLRAVDETEKRSAACHCPLIRDAIRDGRAISPEVCRCSLGHASHYLAGLGVPLEGEVLESAAKGDLRCRFAFRLPPRLVPR